MDTFNRVVIVILLLILIPLMSVFFITPHSILYNTGIWMQNLGEQLWQMRPILRLPLGILLALAFDILAALLIYFEVRRKRVRYIRVEELSGGLATLSIESIAEQLRYQIDPLPNVIKVSPEVKAKGNKVHAVVDVTVKPGANVPQMAAELVGRVKRVLMEDLGLQPAGEPQIRMRVASQPARKAAPPERKVAPIRPKPSTPSAPGVSKGEDEEPSARA
ncbi:MAG: hypothetical protein ACP5HM_07875 [Anaerolineae bacterium]